jgi:hypothetical protein
MSSELASALLGAAVGAVVTIAVSAAARIIGLRDVRAASRRSYSLDASRRLQSIVASTNDVELDAIDTESGFHTMAIDIPSREYVVHIWFLFEFRRLIDLARGGIDSPSDDFDVEFLTDLTDTDVAFHRWARGEIARSYLWFWWQLRTTYQADYADAVAETIRSNKRLVAERRQQANEQREIRLEAKLESHRKARRDGESS